MIQCTIQIQHNYGNRDRVHYKTQKHKDLQQEFEFQLSEYEKCTEKVFNFRIKLDNLEDLYKECVQECEDLKSAVRKTKSKLLLLDVKTSEFLAKINIDLKTLQPKACTILEQQLKAAQTKSETSTKTGVVYKGSDGKFCADNTEDINNSNSFNNNTNNNPSLENSFDNNNIGINDSTETMETTETMEKTSPSKIETETKIAETKAAEITQSKSETETTPKLSKSANSQAPSISFRYGKALKGSHNFFCNYCDRPVTKKYDRDRHIRDSYGPNKGCKNYKCDICPKAYAQKQNLLDHKAAKHGLDVRRYKCGHCNQGFNTNNEAMNHQHFCPFKHGTGDTMQ